MNLTLTKTRLKGAQTGHSLLAKKRDALTTRFRAILRKVDDAKRAMGRVLQLASFSLAEVTYTAGDIGYQVQESVRKASYTVKAKQENVSGVVLPAFEGVRNKDGSGESVLISLTQTSTSQVCPVVDSRSSAVETRTSRPWGRSSSSRPCRWVWGRTAHPDRIHHPRRGHPRDEPSCECHRARRHPEAG